MEQKLKQMTADEKRLLKHIKDKHDNDLKTFVSDQKAAYKAAKNQFKKVSLVDSRWSIYLALSDFLTTLIEARRWGVHNNWCLGSFEIGNIFALIICEKVYSDDSVLERSTVFRVRWIYTPTSSLCTDAPIPSEKNWGERGLWTLSPISSEGRGASVHRLRNRPLNPSCHNIHIQILQTFP